MARARDSDFCRSQIMQEELHHPAGGVGRLLQANRDSSGTLGELDTAVPTLLWFSQ